MSFYRFSDIKALIRLYCLICIHAVNDGDSNYVFQKYLNFGLLFYEFGVQAYFF